MADIPAVIENGVIPDGFQAHFSEAPLDLTHLQEFLNTLKYDNELFFNPDQMVLIPHNRWTTRTYEREKRRKAEMEKKKKRK